MSSITFTFRLKQALRTHLTVSSVPLAGGWGWVPIAAPRRFLLTGHPMSTSSLSFPSYAVLSATYPQGLLLDLLALLV